MKSKYWIPGLLFLTMVTFTFAQESKEDLSQQAANPLADLMSFPFQNNLNMNYGDFSRNTNVLNIQPVLDEEIDQLAEIRNINDKINQLTQIIDRAIYLGYRLFENNYIAQDLLQGAAEWTKFYTPEQKQAFVEGAVDFFTAELAAAVAE